jgi:hypothetical protein
MIDPSQLAIRVIIRQPRQWKSSRGNNTSVDRRSQLPCTV